MANKILTYAQNRDNYSDGEIENEIIDYIKKNPEGSFDEVLQNDDRWPVFYHLSSVRENILNWYPFKKKSSILEIGAGMGAITGALCRSAESVTAVELSERRAEAIYQRYQNYDNLDIIVGNLNDIPFEQKFDYITLIGVLEYAKSFTHSEHPFEDFLNYISTLLKPDGKLLIAIENRFGLKYWCGTPEDHSGIPFEGINGYSDNSVAQTFSKIELENLLTDCGFKNRQFYYPLPDYKLPLVVYSDSYLPKSNITSSIKQYYLNHPALIANEKELLSDIIENRSFPFMANSFLVECCKKELKLSNVSFAKMTSERKPQYQIETLILKNGKVRKAAATELAREHIKAVYQRQNELKASGFPVQESKLVSGQMETEFLHGESLDKILCDHYQKGETEEALKLLSSFYNLILTSSEQVDSAEAEGYFKDKSCGILLKTGYLDLIFSNCFLLDGKMIFFDQEWTAPYIPANFIYFRAIRNLCARPWIPVKEMMELFVPEELISCYEDYDNQFLFQVMLPETGPLGFMEKHIATYHDILDNQISSYFSKLYFDYGEGFHEKDSITSAPHLDGLEMEESFTVPAGVKSIRLDIVENQFCLVNNLEVRANGEILAVTNLNGIHFENVIDVFNTTDPQFLIQTDDKKISEITVKAEVYLIADKNLAQTVTQAAAEMEQYFTKECSAHQNDLFMFGDLVKTLEEKQAVSSEQIRLLESEKSQFLEEIEQLKNTQLQITQQLKDVEFERLLNEDKIKKLENELAAESQERLAFQTHYQAAINQRDELQRQNAQLVQAYSTISNALFWRITKPFRFLLDAVKKIPPLRMGIKAIKCLKQNGMKYTCRKIKYKLSEKQRAKEFVEANILSDEERLQQEQTKFEKEYLISVVVPLYNTPPVFLAEMIDSVVSQTYPKWELCLADGSNNGNEVQKICARYQKNDKRIKYRKLEKNEGISENTNRCLEMATGEYIALFDHDDVLHPAAFYEVMKAINEQNADFVYTDEATFEGKLSNIITAHFKPDFAIDNLRANNYICHLSVFQKELLKKGGYFRKEYDGSQDHDMILRLTSNAKNVVHIPKLLYFWRSHPNSVAADINSKTYAIEAGKNAVKEHLKQCGINAQIESSEAFPTIYRIRYELTENPLVSIIIPNKDHYMDFRRCYNSIKEKTTYSNYEIIVVDNESTNKDILDYYERIASEITLLHWDKPFNYSAVNNYGVSFAKGKYLLFLNSDTEVITPEWIEEMLMYAQRKDVGAVGVKLYYEDNTIQHAGIILGMGADRVAGHGHYKVPKENLGYMGRLCYAQNVSAVTAACMMVRASYFTDVKGFDEQLRIAYNDVDLCMKLRKAGYLNIFTPSAKLYHYESVTRGADDTREKKQRLREEANTFKKHWKMELENGDPYYNANLSLDHSDFRVK